MKILFFGDIVGKIGRRAVAKILPELKEQYQPDIVLANAENLAHGIGITPKTIQEMLEAGVQFFTSGNHVWDKMNGEEVLQAKNPVVVRPDNYGSRKSGVGTSELETPAGKLLVINLQGQIFMKDEVDNPFKALNKILDKTTLEDYAAIFVDFHAEATSEKVAMGWHGDGRVSGVVGTHTHVPTNDARILPHGTAFITDVGMVGARDSVIGVKKEPVLERMLEVDHSRWEYHEEGECDVNAVLIEVGNNRKAIAITPINKTVEV